MKAAMTFFTFFCLLLVSCVWNNDSKKSLVVLINTLPVQQRYLRDEVIGGFEKLYKCKIHFLNYQTNENLINLLAADSANTRIALVSVPFDMARDLASSNKITPLDDIVSESVFQFDSEMYFENFLKFGEIDGKYYYLPHKVEVPVLFYLKSKVSDALSKYLKYQKEIDVVLKAANGFGLPNGYILEENPNEWDLYDIFVVGYIFANEEYENGKDGRIFSQNIFFTSKDNRRVADYASALGADGEDFQNLSGEGLEEMRLWKQYFMENNIFNKMSYSRDVSPLESYLAIRNGDIFMAYFVQNDCFNVVEGTDESRMFPYISDVSDVGVALVPSAVSFTLDKNGNLTNAGRRISEINGFVWGIPENAKEKDLAYLLIQYLNNRNHNTKESVRFGDIPVRQDVLTNLQNIYDERWLGEGYASAIYQIANLFNTETEKER